MSSLRRRVERECSPSCGERCPLWPTAPSVCRRTSLHDIWNPSPTSTTEMTGSDCGMWSTGVYVAVGFDPQEQLLTFTNSRWEVHSDLGFTCFVLVSRFVQGVIGHHYKSDWDVQKDSELQNWIKDIFKHGFLSRASSGNTVQSTIVKGRVGKFCELGVWRIQTQISHHFPVKPLTQNTWTPVYCRRVGRQTSSRSNHWVWRKCLSIIKFDKN